LQVLALPFLRLARCLLDGSGRLLPSAFLLPFQAAQNNPQKQQKTQKNTKNRGKKHKKSQN
jgi:hypothetical protein